jgi:uncharacterized protein YndB with AHSA1/START domain
MSLHIERTFDAPIEKVWKVWTDPNEIKKWWGPNGVTIPECELDLQVGGRIYIIMEATEAMGPYKGTRWPMDGNFTTIEPQAQIAYNAKAWTEGQELETTIEQTTAVVFEAIDGKTKITIDAAITNAGPGAQMAVQGMEQGFNQQLDKLETFLNN